MFSCMNTGLGNVNVVVVVPSALVFTEPGFKATSENGNILLPGYPFTTSLICSVTGILSSFELKKISIDVKNTPPSSSIRNVCANGSTHPTVLVDCLVDSLVEIIVFCTVSKIPLAT